MQRWLGITVGVIVAGCQAGGQPQDMGGGPPPTAVQIQPVSSDRITDSDTYVARLDNRELATVQPQVSGQVSEVFVQLGDRISAGEPLLQIRPLRQAAVAQSEGANVAAAQAAIATAQANVQSSRAELRSRQADLELAQIQQERNQSLVSEGVIAREALDESTRAVAQAEAQVAAQEEQVLAQEAAVRQAEQALLAAQATAATSEIDLSLYRVAAPVSGIVGEVNVRIGDLVTNQSVITTVGQDTALEVAIQIPLNRAPDIEVGTPVELLDASGEAIARTQISFIAPDVDPATQTILVRAIADNSISLRNDQFIRARVIWQEYDSLVIPLTAITRLAGQEFVYVALEQETGLVASQQPVELGRIQGNYYELLSGLEAGESIVTSGLQKLFPMAPIVSEDDAAEPTALAQ